MLPSKIAVCLLACLGGGSIVSAASLPQMAKRDTISTALYAYGTNITGLEVSFVNGSFPLLYICRKKKRRKKKAKKKAKKEERKQNCHK